MKFLRVLQQNHLTIVKRYLAEGIGTFFLVFFGTGAVAVDHWSSGALGHQGIAWAFGGVVAVVIYALGSISGAHLNPAVSIAFAVADLFDRKYLLGYCIAQCIGAILASILVAYLVDNTIEIGTTVPAISLDRAFVVELLLTYFLMLVILRVSQDSEHQSFTGVVVGSAVFLAALVAGPFTGASMNPARTLGPACISGEWTAWWLYWLAPILGAVLASWNWRWWQPRIS